MQMQHGSRLIHVVCHARECGATLQVDVPSTHLAGDGEVHIECNNCNRLLRVQLPSTMLAPSTVVQPPVLAPSLGHTVTNHQSPACTAAPQLAVADMPSSSNASQSMVLAAQHPQDIMLDDDYDPIEQFLLDHPSLSLSEADVSGAMHIDTEDMMQQQQVLGRATPPVTVNLRQSYSWPPVSLPLPPSTIAAVAAPPLTAGAAEAVRTVHWGANHHQHSNTTAPGAGVSGTIIRDVPTLPAAQSVPPPAAAGGGFVQQSVGQHQGSSHVPVFLPGSEPLAHSISQGALNSGGSAAALNELGHVTITGHGLHSARSAPGGLALYMCYSDVWAKATSKSFADSPGLHHDIATTLAMGFPRAGAFHA